MGVEPFPYEEGEHLVDASGKLMVLDRLLQYMVDKNHYVLIFSQFVRFLDIIQDFMDMRGYNYARLDGCSKNEDRISNVKQFQKSLEERNSGNTTNDSNGCRFFLLSTKAGGFGLNLTAADTVIFMDSSWNPHNDIQAMARCHRIGQENSRIKKSCSDVKMRHATMLKAFGDGLDKLRANDAMTAFNCDDGQLEKLIGTTTADGEWATFTQDTNVLIDAEQLDHDDVDDTDYLVYNGVSYRIDNKERIRKRAASEPLENTSASESIAAQPSKS